MNSETMYITYITLAISILSGIGAAWSYFKNYRLQKETHQLQKETHLLRASIAESDLSKRKENLTLNLLERLSSTDMVNSRMNAWVFLDKKYNEDINVTMRDLWESDDPNEVKVAGDVYRILEFWMTIHNLKEQDRIDLGIGNSHLKYQWNHWFCQLETICNNTIENDQKEEKIMFSGFLESHMNDWLGDEDIRPSKRRQETPVADE